jgi:hypothetical protein
VIETNRRKDVIEKSHVGGLNEGSDLALRSWELVLSIKFHGADQLEAEVTQNVFIPYRPESKLGMCASTCCCLGRRIVTCTEVRYPRSSREEGVHCEVRRLQVMIDLRYKAPFTVAGGMSLSFLFRYAIGESSLNDRSAQVFPYNIFTYCSIVE